MNTTNDPMQPDPANEQMLFDAYRATAQEAGRDVDPMELAAWLDDTLDDDETAAVESQMARDADIRELASAHRLEPDLVADPLSPALLKRLHLRTAPCRFASSHPHVRLEPVGVICRRGRNRHRHRRLPRRTARRDQSYSNEDRFLATATFNVFDDDTGSGTSCSPSTTTWRANDETSHPALSAVLLGAVQRLLHPRCPQWNPQEPQGRREWQDQRSRWSWT